MEKVLQKYLKLRAGLILPLIAHTSTIGNILNDIPFPKIGGSIGIGVEIARFVIDLAAYGDPGKSYVEHEPKVAFTGTVAFNF